jgi:hypothetical protein
MFESKVLYGKTNAVFCGEKLLSIMFRLCLFSQQITALQRLGM